MEEIVASWTDGNEPERGQKYAHDLPAEAIRQLSDPTTAHTGRNLRHTEFPEAQEYPVFKRSYRILYRVRESEGVVEAEAVLQPSSHSGMIAAIYPNGADGNEASSNSFLH